MHVYLTLPYLLPLHYSDSELTLLEFRRLLKTHQFAEDSGAYCLVMLLTYLLIHLPAEIQETGSRSVIKRGGQRRRRRGSSYRRTRRPPPP